MSLPDAEGLRLPYDEGKPGHTHYRVFVGNGAAFDMVQGIKLAQFTDGTSTHSWSSGCRRYAVD